MSTPHPDFEALSAHHDGEAPEVAAHVADCAACRTTLRWLRATTALVASPVPPVAPEFGTGPGPGRWTPSSTLKVGRTPPRAPLRSTAGTPWLNLGQTRAAASATAGPHAGHGTWAGRSLTARGSLRAQLGARARFGAWAGFSAGAGFGAWAGFGVRAGIGVGASPGGLGARSGRRAGRAGDAHLGGQESAPGGSGDVAGGRIGGGGAGGGRPRHRRAHGRKRGWGRRHHHLVAGPLAGQERTTSGLQGESGAVQSSSADNAGGGPGSVAGIDAGDLGQIADGQALAARARPVLLQRDGATAAPASESSTPAGVAGIAGTDPAPISKFVGTRPCEMETRTARPELGTVVYFATGQVAGTPVVVLGFAAGPAPAPVTLLALAQQEGCRVVLEAAGP